MVSGQRRVKQVPWQLTDQTCELLEGIRCADSLAMFLDQDATAFTMKNMKEGRTAPWTRKIEAPYLFMRFMVSSLVRLFTMNDTKSMKATSTYPWARKQDPPSISSCASWLVSQRCAQKV